MFSCEDDQLACGMLQRGLLMWQSRSIFSAFTEAQFRKDIEGDKLIKFTSQQLKIATDNFSNMLGVRGNGVAYRGVLCNETVIAVKVLRLSSDMKMKKFIAEVSTPRRVRHGNLVKLYGFCFERKLKALVYEYIANNLLDKYLFHEIKSLGFEKLHEIAVGTARGIAYLHEECQQRIIYYDIKPENILLDEEFTPKVDGFCVEKLWCEENVDTAVSEMRGTPGYAAPELPYPVTHKYNVYSFGMLLFEIVGRRKNLDMNLPEGHVWFPLWACRNFDVGRIGELTETCGIEGKKREVAERMVKVAFWCVQYEPESRPSTNVVVKMLEEAVEIQKPPKPFPPCTMRKKDGKLSTATSPNSSSDQ